MSQARKLRIIQIVAVLYVLLLFLVLHAFPEPAEKAAMTPFKWIIILLACYCAVSARRLQKRFLRAPANPQAAVKSPPLRRWFAGNLIRMACTVAASLYGILLHFAGGPDWLAAGLIGLGLILLLIWNPGKPPEQEQQEAR